MSQFIFLGGGSKGKCKPIKTNKKKNSQINLSEIRQKGIRGVWPGHIPARKAGQAGRLRELLFRGEADQRRQMESPGLTVGGWKCVGGGCKSPKCPTKKKKKRKKRKKKTRPWGKGVQTKKDGKYRTVPTTQGTNQSWELSTDREGPHLKKGWGGTTGGEERKKGKRIVG